ncbi:MAG: BolA family protein [Candidatus Eutrophobiaceae bacterium]
MTIDRPALIQNALEQALQPILVEVNDDSAEHADHAPVSGGHFSVRIVCGQFAEKSLRERHMMVYQALGELMQTEIHAVRIDARAPDEVELA